MTSNTRLSLSLPVVIAPILFPLSAVLAYYRAGSYFFTIVFKLCSLFITLSKCLPLGAMSCKLTILSRSVYASPIFSSVALSFPS
jgi:hypothetical protein